MIQIYIAAKFSARGRLRKIRDAIHAGGRATVISSWLDLEEEHDTLTENAREGQRDWNEVLDADLLLIDTTEPTRRGGREVELGIALGAGLDAWVIGPRINVFHALCPQWADWAEALRQLRCYRKE